MGSFYDLLLASKLSGGGGGGGGGVDYLAQFFNETLEEYESDEVTKVIARGGQQTTSLKRISLPNCIEIKGNGFAYDTNLETVNLPKVARLEQSVFEGCSKLEGIVLPSCTYMYNSVFQNCSKLKYADIKGSNGVNWGAGSAFNGCSIFDTLIIRENAITPLPNINWFNSTPFKSGGTGGVLFVPSAQISNYQSASNWSTILGYANNQIKAIEGSIYETKYADGTPISA